MANPKDLLKGYPGMPIEIPHYAQGDAIMASDGSSGGGARVVPVFNVAPGTRIIKAGITVTTVANPTGTTVTLGDSDSADRLLATANVTETTAGSYEYVAGFTYQSSDPSVINAVVTSTGDARNDAMTFFPYVWYLPNGNRLE